jgi:hypothetical protein
MLKIDIEETKHFFKKFNFIILILILLFGGIFLSGFIVSFVPAIFFLIFFLFEKYTLKNEKLKKYNILDLVATSIFYGIIAFITLLFLNKII